MNNGSNGIPISLNRIGGVGGPENNAPPPNPLAGLLAMKMAQKMGIPD